MSHVTKAFDAIKLASHEVKGGLGEIAALAGVKPDTARRLVRKPPTVIDTLKKLETAAQSILDKRANPPTA